MGWYIQTDSNRDKAQWLVDHAGGVQLMVPPPYEEIPKGYCMIVVIHNPTFEAAGFAFDENEYLSFIDPEDDRFCEYVLIKRDKAIELTGYIEK